MKAERRSTAPVLALGLLFFVGGTLWAAVVLASDGPLIWSFGVLVAGSGLDLLLASRRDGKPG